MSQLLGREVPHQSSWIDDISVALGNLVRLENCRANEGERKKATSLPKKWRHCVMCTSAMLSVQLTAQKPPPTASPNSRAVPAPDRCLPQNSMHWGRH